MWWSLWGFSQVLCLHRVLPVLFSECANADMVPFALQNILIIADRSTKEEYFSLLFPQLVPLMKIRQPIHVTLYNILVFIAAFLCLICMRCTVCLYMYISKSCCMYMYILTILPMYSAPGLASPILYLLFTAGFDFELRWCWSFFVFRRRWCSWRTCPCY